MIGNHRLAIRVLIHVSCYKANTFADLFKKNTLCIDLSSKQIKYHCLLQQQREEHFTNLNDTKRKRQFENNLLFQKHIFFLKETGKQLGNYRS